METIQKEEDKMNILKSTFILLSILFLVTMASNSYFSDKKAISGNQVATGKWSSSAKIVINEVYYDVAPDKGNEGNQESLDEWIELYNPNSYPVNLKNWTISDNGATRTINADNSIPAHGFAVISKSRTTWSLYWPVPAGVEIIELGQKIGNGLSNDGDRIILKDASGNIIDQMSYGNDNTVFNPPCPDVAEGHSLERSPAGKDTDTKEDFIDQANPTPGIGI